MPIPGDRESLEIERDDQRFSFEIVELKVGRVGHARSLAPIHRAILNSRENTLLQPVAKAGHAIHRPVAQSLGCQFSRFAQADDTGNVLRPGAALTLVRAAKEERLDPRSPSNIQDARALRRVHLVSRDAQQIAADGLDVDIDLAGRLHRVGMEPDVGLLRDAADLFTGWITPVSLFAIITLISLVFGRSARRTSSGSTRPSRDTGRNVTSTPRSRSRSAACSTAWCSIDEVIT